MLLFRLKKEKNHSSLSESDRDWDKDFQRTGRCCSISPFPSPLPSSASTPPHRAMADTQPLPHMFSVLAPTGRRLATPSYILQRTACDTRLMLVSAARFTRIVNTDNVNYVPVMPPPLFRYPPTAHRLCGGGAGRSAGTLAERPGR